MLKQLRPLSLMLALAAVLPAAQASVLTCNFNDITPNSDGSLTGLSDSCGATKAAVRFGSDTFLGKPGDGFDPSTAPGYPGFKVTPYLIGGTSLSISLESWVNVDTLTLDLLQPATLGVAVSLVVTGRNIDPITKKPVTHPVGEISVGNGSGIRWTQLQNADGKPISLVLSDLGGISELMFTSDAGVAIDNLQLSLSDAPAVVPEPSLFGLTALALAAAGFAGRRRQVRGA